MCEGHGGFGGGGNGGRGDGYEGSECKQVPSEAFLGSEDVVALTDGLATRQGVCKGREYFTRLYTFNSWHKAWEMEAMNQC